MVYIEVTNDIGNIIFGVKVPLDLIQEYINQASVLIGLGCTLSVREA